MVKPKKKEADAAFTYNAGFIGLRFAATDETTGEALTVPGVSARMRLKMIDAYHAGEPGTVVIYTRGQSEPGVAIGTLDELDAIFRRHQLFVMNKEPNE